MVSHVKAWEAEFSAYAAARGPALRNLAYLICGDWHRAEDHTQIALTRLYQVWRRIERRDSIDAYARKTLVRTVLAERRRPWRREHSAGEIVDLPVPAEADAVPQRMAVAAALAGLPPRQRAAVVLRYWSDQSVAETARLLGVTEGTVKASCARGLATLRSVLQDEHIGGATW
jgi:RNA polymerase sigma-70 factor (sigma-E family)